MAEGTHDTIEFPLDVIEEQWQYKDSILKAVQYTPDNWTNILKLFFIYVLKNPDITFTVENVPSSSYKRLSFKYPFSGITSVLNATDYLVVKNNNENEPYLDVMSQAVMQDLYKSLGDEAAPPSPITIASQLEELYDRLTAIETTPQVEFRIANDYIQYKRANENAWNNLISKTDLTGPSGPTGPAGEPGTPGNDALDQTSLIASKISKDFIKSVWNNDNFGLTSITVRPDTTNPTKKANIVGFYANAETNVAKEEIFVLELGDKLVFAPGSTANSIKIDTTP
jgi:hypothetical protein